MLHIRGSYGVTSSLPNSRVHVPGAPDSSSLAPRRVVGGWRLRVCGAKFKGPGQGAPAASMEVALVAARRAGT